jgi:hypothetical protein
MSEAVLIGLLFADRIIIENNNKKGIIGTFTVFHSPVFPVAFPPWAIYAAVTNLEGKHTFALNLMLEETNQVIFSLSGDFEVEKLINAVELTPTISPIFPQPGVYNLHFFIDGQQVGSRNVLVELLSKKGG